MQSKDDTDNIDIYEQFDKFESILIIKNNLEKIENKLDNIKPQKTNFKDIIKYPLICFTLALVAALLIPSISIVGFKVALGFIALNFITTSLLKLSTNIDADKKIKLSNKLRLKLLIEEYNKEKEMLEYLENTIDKNIIDYGEIKITHKSQVILQLENKLKLIRDYCNNKKAFINLYKNGLIHSMGNKNKYSMGEIEFIKFLIEEELKNDNLKEKNKDKIKRLSK